MLLSGLRNVKVLSDQVPPVGRGDNVLFLTCLGNRGTGRAHDHPSASGLVLSWPPPPSPVPAIPVPIGLSCGGAQISQGSSFQR